MLQWKVRICLRPIANKVEGSVRSLFSVTSEEFCVLYLHSKLITQTELVWEQWVKENVCTQPNGNKRKIETTARNKLIETYFVSCRPLSRMIKSSSIRWTLWREEMHIKFYFDSMHPKDHLRRSDLRWDDIIKKIINELAWLHPVGVWEFLD
jgi:hypothetical protein